MVDRPILLLCSSALTKSTLNKHCGNIYCGHLWAEYSEYHSVKMMVLYNNAFRILFRFHKILQRYSAIFGDLRTPSYVEIVRISILYVGLRTEYAAVRK